MAAGGGNLSIILPCYNVQDYVEECLNSILNQDTKYQYTVYAINDGSTDNTLNILKKYERLENVIIIDKENGGAGQARNVALDMVKSEYVMFVDADDYLANGCVEKLMNAACSVDADIAEAGLRYFDKKKILWECRHENGVFDSGINAPLFGFPVAKVIKSKLFDSIRFSEIGYEDTVFIYTLYPQVKKVCLIDDIVYLYRKNDNGCTRSKVNISRGLDSFYITEQLLKDAALLNVDKEYLYNITLDQIITNYGRIYFMSLDVHMAVFKLTCDWLDKYFKAQKTNVPKFIPLEKTLRERNFSAYYRYMRING